MTTISVTNETVDIDRSVELRVLHTSPLTPRRLAKAYKIANEERDYFLEHFRFHIAPRHSIRLVIDNGSKCWMDDIHCQWHDGATWASICAELEKAAQNGLINPLTGDLWKKYGNGARG